MVRAGSLAVRPSNWWMPLGEMLSLQHGNMEVHYIICCFSKFGTRKWGTGTSFVTKTFAHQSHHSLVHQDQLSDHPQLEWELVHPRLFAKCWVKTCVDGTQVKLVI